MKYCTVVCVIFLFVCLVTIFLFWIFEPRARRVSVIIISSVVCVVVFIYILRPIVGFPPPPHPTLFVFFFFFFGKKKKKNGFAIIVRVCARVTVSNIIFFFGNLLSNVVKNNRTATDYWSSWWEIPPSPQFFFLCVCVWSCSNVWPCYKIHSNRVKNKILKIHPQKIFILFYGGGDVLLNDRWHLYAKVTFFYSYLVSLTRVIGISLLPLTQPTCDPVLFFY